MFPSLLELLSGHEAPGLPTTASTSTHPGTPRHSPAFILTFQCDRWPGQVHSCALEFPSVFSSTATRHLSPARRCSFQSSHSFKCYLRWPGQPRRLSFFRRCFAKTGALSGGPTTTYSRARLLLPVLGSEHTMPIPIESSASWAFSGNHLRRQFVHMSFGRVTAIDRVVPLNCCDHQGFCRPSVSDFKPIMHHNLSPPVSILHDALASLSKGGGRIRHHYTVHHSSGGRLRL